MSVISIKELIVDKKIIKKVSSTIKNYNKKPTPLLLVGQSGIGKTTLILSIAKSLNYKVTNIDPESNFTKNVKSFFIQKEIILLDNLDEIKGKNLTELINHFKNDGRPLIMCTSEVHQDLQKIKQKLSIRATNYKFDLTEWVEYLTQKYNMERSNIKHLVKQTKFNKGIAINQLILYSTDLNGCKINKKLNMFEVFENAFNKDVDRSDYYFRETLLPLFVFENYPKLKNNSIEYCTNSSSACAITDVMETFMNHKQYYEFMPYVNIFTTEMATFDYNEKINYPRFPEYFSKMKKKIKDEDSLLLEIKLKNSLKIVKK